ncbi:hypothetical protein [Myxococcus sp. RHSTA-1-4]|uniref:hypothetical protein n=1 Tax=Myxococcus sp. RHSTA-1-4 TaxID=2874601 RepID=UPI001CC0B413|nr:hypothetical protein [Myxococcus sp. RHSTA-1-4]MBZ4419640.1 hypothetical protein [Myxococcus sp. RHSTA-1-4]
MNSRLLAAFLCLAAAAPGCIVREYDDPDEAYPGDVTFRWTFAGLRCDEDRDIAGVNITIPGERLQNNGEYPCSANGFDGIVLHDFGPGVYSFNVEGVSYTGEILYAVSGTFRVDGNVTVSVDMTPTGTPPSYAYVSWLFPANNVSSNPTCSQAGITAVDVRVDDGEFQRIDCVRGQGANSVQTPYLDPGEHFVEFIAVDANGAPWYHYSGTLITEAGRPTSHIMTLWAIGGASIAWEIVGNGSRLTCSQARISEVRINFRDVFTNELVYGIVGDGHGCNDAPVVYEFLRPGRYRVEISARASDGRVYLSAANEPPIDVVAHQFPGPNSALVVPIFMQ